MSRAAAYTYVVLLCIAGLLCLLVAYRVWRRSGGRRLARLFWQTMGVAALWPFCSALSAVVDGEQAATRLLLFRYGFMGLTAPMAMLFMLAYTDRISSWRARFALLFVVPALFWLLAFVSPESILREPRFSRTGPLLLIESYRAHWGFWLHTIHAYALLAITFSIQVAAALDSRSVRRVQNLMVLGGSCVFVVANLATRAGSFGEELIHLDWSGASMSGVALVWYWAIFRYRALDLTPVARDRLLETMTDAVLVLDEDGRILDANRSARPLLRPPRQSPIGKPIVEAVPAELSAWHAQTSRERDSAAEIEMLVAGGYRRFDVRLLPLHGRPEQKVGELLVLHDVTERAAMIQDLDAYARTVAHDLKNPLGVIRGYVELLDIKIGEQLDEPHRRLIVAALRRADAMVEIVDDLLLLARVRQTTPDDREPIDMQAAVARARERLDPMIHEAGALLVVPEHWPSARGHAPWVCEVWVNYMSNAIKYGGTPPRVEIGFDDPGGECWRFWVRDNGNGIAADDQDRLFREFSRIHSARTDSHGLGLSIVKRIVEKLGGSVGVSSTPGRGSRFWFTLPRASEPERTTG